MTDHPHAHANNQPQGPTALCELASARQEEFIQRFEKAGSDEQRMRELIALGRSLEQLPPEEWTEERRVLGCQSRMYLKMTPTDQGIHLQVGSDALIAAGLAALIVNTFQGCTPEQILRCPFFLPDRIGLAEKLTPGRSNGMDSLLREIKRRALQVLMGQH
jgi:cysteine desulfuration protein SufE